jgi:hypothetical protein
VQPQNPRTGSQGRTRLYAEVPERAAARDRGGARAGRASAAGRRREVRIRSITGGSEMNPTTCIASPPDAGPAIYAKDRRLRPLAGRAVAELLGLEDRLRAR